MAFKKKNILVTGIATVTAAAMLLGGGTLAYLQGETNDVVNEFKTNEVLVDLDETTGNDYNIIPGTSETKDPKVTVNNTVDSYVYVQVTDATDGLVTYEIADGWTLLDGYTDVYYREVAADAAEKEFYVLKDNTVTYDASLENSDMVNPDGTVKEGVTLSFKAYAIQKDPFNDPVNAYVAKEATLVSSADDFKNAIAAAQDGETVFIGNDIALTEPLTINKDITVMGDGNTVISEMPVYVANDANVTFKNVAFTAPTNAKNNATSLYATNYAGKLVVEDCTFTNFQWEAIQCVPKAGAEIVINNCYFENTNTMAENGFETKRYVHVEVTDSSVAPTDVTVAITNNTFKNVTQSSLAEGTGYFTDSAVTVCGVALENINCANNVFTGKVVSDALTNPYIIWIQDGRSFTADYFGGFEIAADAELV